MKPPLRIAILECDTPLTDTRSRYGGYGGVFTALLKAGADSLGQPDVLSSKHGLDLSCYDVVEKMEYPILDDIDAVLITGSKFNSFDSNPWILKLVKFTQSLLKQHRIRIIGVCFGHQIIGRALGAPVGRSDRGWEISMNQIATTPKGAELFGGLKSLNLMQMHRDIVFAYPHTGTNDAQKGKIPNGASHTTAGTNGAHETRDLSTITSENSEVPALQIEPLGHSPLCEVQGMYARGRLITVQGHPEFDERIVRELLQARHEQAIFDDEMFEDGMKRVVDRNDGVIVAAAFLRFLLED